MYKSTLLPKSAKLKIKNRQGNGFIIKKNDKKYCKFFFTHLVKKKTSVKKVNFRITKPFSQLKSISALILPGIETVIGNNLSFELFYHIGEVLSSKVFTKVRATAFTF